MLILLISSLGGAIAIISGLYMVLWGKAQDFDSTITPHEDSSQIFDQERGSDNTDVKEPLLSKSFCDAQTS